MGRTSRPAALLAVIGPGLLTAATGVGAGDLATGSLVGNRLGVAVLWAVLVGAALKLVLTEGLARWQLATGETLLEGALGRSPPVVAWCFCAYLVVWSFFVGAALISACGVAAHAVVPLFDPVTDKRLWGTAHALVGLAVVWIGGFKWFERVMGVAVGVMFVAVVGAAALVVADPPASHVDVLSLGALARGALIPSIPQGAPEGDAVGWTVALLGGVGGTVTVLSYGYWIRERGRSSPAALGTCRIDLAVGYGATALFGMAMVVLGATIAVEGSGATLVVRLGDRLAGLLGPAGRALFLAGAWAALFSSLLGVWQSVPYLFADTVRIMRSADTEGRRAAVDARSRPYRIFLVGLALVPLLGLWVEFSRVQKLYAVLGALFMPALAVVLLVLGSPRRAMGPRLSNGLFASLLLLATLALFAWFGWQKLAAAFAG